MRPRSFAHRFASRLCFVVAAAGLFACGGVRSPAPTEPNASPAATTSITAVAQVPNATVAPSATAAPTPTSEPSATLEPTATEVPDGPCPTGGEFIYFFEDKEDKIQKYGLDGQLVCEWPLIGEDGQTFAVAPGQNRLTTVWASGAYLGQYNLTGAMLEPMRDTDCLTANPGIRETTAMRARADAEGSLVVMLAASFASKGLLKCTAEGDFVALSAGLNNVVDFAIDPDGNVWVISVVVDAFSESQLVVLSGDDFERLASYDIPGLRGVTVDAQGDILVTQYIDDVTGDHKVLKLDGQGNLLAEWGQGNGRAPGEFARPEMIATDSAGNIYVYNDNWRVVKLNPEGEYLAEFSTAEWLHHGMVIVQE